MTPLTLKWKDKDGERYWYAVEITYVTDEDTGVRKRTTKWHSLKLKGKRNRRIAEQMLHDLMLTQVQRSNGAVQSLLPPYFDEYLVSVKLSVKPATYKSYEFWLEKFSLVHSHAMITDITPHDIDAFKVALAKSYKPASVNVALRNLRAVFNDAVRKGVLQESPMRATKMLTVPKKTFPPFITMRQFKSVVLAVVTDQRHRVAFSLAMLAGLRRREIANLRWDQVDFEAGTISIESREDFQTKSGRGRVLPLYSTLREELLKLCAKQHVEDDRRCAQMPQKVKPELKREYVLQARLRIPDSISLNEAWMKYIDRFMEADPSFPRITLHGLRHSFATWLASEAGLNLRALQALLGHAHIETTMVYAHIQPQLAVEAAKSFDV